MTPREANIIITKAGLFDGRQSSVEKAEAWAEVLDGIELDEALEAVARHYRRSNAYLMPADIRGLVKSIRDDREREAAKHRPRLEVVGTPPPGGSVKAMMALYESGELEAAADG